MRTLLVREDDWPDGPRAGGFDPSGRRYDVSVQENTP